MEQVADLGSLGYNNQYKQTISNEETYLLKILVFDDALCVQIYSISLLSSNVPYFLLQKHVVARTNPPL